MRSVLRWVLFLVLLVLGSSLLFALWGVASSLLVARAIGLKADWRVLAWARFWTLVYRVPWPLYVAILHREAASQANGEGRYPLGDVNDRKGPALGPGQVLRVNVERLWSGLDRSGLRGQLLAFLVRRGLEPAQLDQVSATRASVWASVVVLSEALQASQGAWREAARRYNGSGDRAERYADATMRDVETLQGKTAA